jgi:DDE superfamily endonuclease
LNNIVEQDHRRIKQRVMPMLGFKGFDTATVTISGHRTGREDQESSVQDRKTDEPIGDNAVNLGGCSGRLSETKGIRVRSLSCRQLCTRAIL